MDRKKNGQEKKGETIIQGNRQMFFFHSKEVLLKLGKETDEQNDERKIRRTDKQTERQKDEQRDDQEK